MAGKYNFVFIVNSKTRQSDMSVFTGELNAWSKEHTSQITVRTTEYAGHATVIAKELVDNFNPDTIAVAVGGDGTVHEIANALAQTPVPMAVLPLGTGNDFARSIMDKTHQQQIGACVSDLIKGDFEIRGIDLIRVESYDKDNNPIPECCAWCNNVASIGFDTDVQSLAKEKVRKHPTSKTVKNTAYMTSAVSLLFGKRGHKFAYTSNRADGGSKTSTAESYTMVTACNGRYYGDGFNPAPAARVDDGLMDISSIEDVSLARALSLILKYMKGTHVGKKNVDSFKCSEFTVETRDGKNLLGNYDGEDFEGRKVTFRLVPKSLKLVFYK